MIKFWRKKPLALDDSTKLYESQVSSIQSICETTGFKEMIAWWENEYERVDNLLDTSEPAKLEVLRIERGLIKKHLVWLNRLLNAELKGISKPASD